MEAARESVRKDTVKRLMTEIRALEISVDELMDYIRKEEGEHEHTRS